MKKIVSKTIKIKADFMPPGVSFIEKEIKKQGFSPIRWAIVEVEDNILTLSISGFEI